jgi:cell division protein FtsX
VTFSIEVALTFFIAKEFSVRFIEVMFFTGIAFAAISFYFSSSGGIVSDYSSSQVSAQTGFIQKRETFVFRRGAIFTSSIIFFLIGLVLFILLILGIISPVKN